MVTTAGPDDDPAGLAAALGPAARIESLPFAVPKRGTGAFARALACSWFTRYPVDLWKWREARVERRVRELVTAGSFDVVVADFLFAIANVPAALPVPLAFFEHNVEYLIWKRLADVETRAWRRALLGIEWRKVRRAEAQACARAAITIAVSDEDRTLLEQDAPDTHLVTIPTGVETSYFQPDDEHERPDHLVFSGSMDWYPNEDAVIHFVESIWPRIRQARPFATFTIIGRHPSPRVRALGATPGVQVSGTVDDVRPLIAEGAVYVVPLRVGGGTRLKIFEALAMGKAVVSTTIGAEGLGVTPDRHLVLADDPVVFADAVIALLGDRAGRRALGAEGRRIVVEQYSWARVGQEFERHLRDAATRHYAPRTDRALRTDRGLRTDRAPRTDRALRTDRGPSTEHRGLT